MTKLNKSLQRETSACFQKRPIIIQLEPPSIIRVKEKGRRTWYETSVEAVFSFAVKRHVERVRAGKKARRGGKPS